MRWGRETFTLHCYRVRGAYISTSFCGSAMW
nr:MAG TPA: hypothetical protein [Caudoviricetes sp.]